MTSLRYHLVVDDPRHSFAVGASWKGHLGEFACELHDGVLTATPTAEFEGIREAQEAIEPYVFAWGLHAELVHRIPMRFEFREAEEQQESGTPTRVGVYVTNMMGLRDDTEVGLMHSFYPDPPSRPLSDARFIWELRAMRQNTLSIWRSLLADAYLFLTRLEYEYGGRRQSARALNLDLRILRKLGELTARNDPAARRKVAGPVQPLSGEERGWIAECLRVILHRAAEVEAGQVVSRMTMSDLPPLSN